VAHLGKRARQVRPRLIERTATAGGRGRLLVRRRSLLKAMSAFKGPTIRAGTWLGPLVPSRGHFDQRIRAPVSCRVGVRYAKGLGSTSVAENHPHRRRLTGTRVAPGSNPRE